MREIKLELEAGKGYSGGFGGIWKLGFQHRIAPVIWIGLVAGINLPQIIKIRRIVSVSHGGSYYQLIAVLSIGARVIHWRIRSV